MFEGFAKVWIAGPEVPPAVQERSVVSDHATLQFHSYSYDTFRPSKASGALQGLRRDGNLAAFDTWARPRLDLHSRR